MYVVVFALQEVGSPATDKLVTRRELEIELQSKLNESGITRGLGEAKCAVGIWVVVRASGLRCCLIEPVLGSDIRRNGVGIGEFRIQMIESIEELCPELEALLFADGKNLKQ